MKSVPPSELAAKEIQSLLEAEEEREQGGQLLSELVRKGVRRIIQEALEEEVTAFLGRARYERRGEDADGAGPWRNGYKRRSVRTAEGRVVVDVPQVRNAPEPYHSRLWSSLKGNSEGLEWLATEMYARGLSTRDIEEAFVDRATGEKLLSKSQVSRMSERLAEEYEAFATRDLSEFEVVYLFLDAVYEPLRRIGRAKEAILCCWGILASGDRLLLHMDIAQAETYTAWKVFLEDMVRRGLRSPVTVTTDGSAGLIRAVEETWSQSLRIRCWVHKMQNILDKVPQEAQPEVKAYLTSVRDAPDWATGRQLADQFIAKFRGEYGRAVAAFEDDLEASLAHLRVPAVHRRTVRTTNLVERSFGEERRRTKVLPRFMSEEGGIKLIFATLWRVSERWRGVRFSEHERQLVEKLRRRMFDEATEESQNKELDATA